MSKLIITRKDGSTVDVEPNKMWEPHTDAELVEVLRGELKAVQAENVRIKMDVKSLEIANRESMNMLIERDDEIKRLKSETYCAYCGERFELDNGSASLVSEHIRTCVKHPMRAVEAENVRLCDALEAAQAENAKLREISALVSQRHGDDDAFGEDEDDENDLPVVITMKRIFNILDGRIYE